MPTTDHKTLERSFSFPSGAIGVRSRVAPGDRIERAVDVSVSSMTSQKTMTARIPVDVADQLSAAIINARDTALAATIVPDPKPEPAPAAASTDIVFVSAPPTRDDARRSNRRYHEFAEALRARPGEWGQYPRQMQSTNSAATTAAKIARGIPNAFPITDAGRFDATSDGRTVYVRYLLGGEA